MASRLYSYGLLRLSIKRWLDSVCPLFSVSTHLACGSKVTKALQHWTSRHRGWHSEGCNFMSKASNPMDVGGINHQVFQGAAWNFKTCNAPIQHFYNRWNLPEICWLIWITKQRWKSDLIKFQNTMVILESMINSQIIHLESKLTPNVRKSPCTQAHRTNSLGRYNQSQSFTNLWCFLGSGPSASCENLPKQLQFERELCYPSAHFPLEECSGEAPEMPAAVMASHKTNHWALASKTTIGCWLSSL